MMKSKHALLAAMVSVAASGAFAKPLHEEDAPRTQEDVIAAALERFDIADVDQDGYLSDAEIDEMKPKGPGRNPEARMHRDDRGAKEPGSDRHHRHPNLEDSFEKADKNGDGSLSFQEFKDVLHAHKGHKKPGEKQQD